MTHCAVCQVEAATPRPAAWITLEWSYQTRDGHVEDGRTEYCGPRCLVQDWSPDGTIGGDIAAAEVSR